MLAVVAALGPLGAVSDAGLMAVRLSDLAASQASGWPLAPPALPREVAIRLSQSPGG
jgi:hypothetical protein